MTIPRRTRARARAHTLRVHLDELERRPDFFVVGRQLLVDLRQHVPNLLGERVLRPGRVLLLRRQVLLHQRPEVLAFLEAAGAGADDQEGLAELVQLLYRHPRVLDLLHRLLFRRRLELGIGQERFGQTGLFLPFRALFRLPLAPTGQFFPLLLLLFVLDELFLFLDHFEPLLIGGAIGIDFQLRFIELKRKEKVRF